MKCTAKKKNKANPPRVSRKHQMEVKYPSESQSSSNYLPEKKLSTLVPSVCSWNPTASLAFTSALGAPVQPGAPYAFLVASG